MSVTREKFAAQGHPKSFPPYGPWLEKEGQQLQAVVDEALADRIEKRKRATPRPYVMGAYLASHEKYAPLYNKLAK